MAKSKYRKKTDSSIASFRRRGKAVLPGSSILIVTEGENTEPIYFEEFKNSFAAPTIELVPVGAGANDPRYLVDEALRIRKERRRRAKANELRINQLKDFDELWIVFDIDILRNQPSKLHNGIAYANSKKVKVAHSDPCFEYWLLLHNLQGYTTAPMLTCDDVSPYLLKAFEWNSYAKENNASRKLLQPLITKKNVQTAVIAAGRVRNHHASAATTFPANPSTEVDKLIRTINEALSPANKFL